jgi:predicted LPLAT superfamily acyltransferase
MDDGQFLRRIQDKIERMAGRPIELQVNQEEATQILVELERPVPLVVLGSHIFQYSGFARMCVEYVVASLRQRRAIDTLEFHLLLARN